MRGKQIPDVCGSLSPKEKLQADKKGATCYTGMKYRICCAVLVALPSLLFLVFLSLYLQSLYSISAREMKKCQVELQNRTSHMRANLDGLGKRVKETESDLEKARAERDGLRAELAVANRSLEKAREDWGSCQGQLKSLEKNATSQVKEAVQREMEKNKVAEDKIAKRQSKVEQEKRSRVIFTKERDAHQRTIGELRDQIARQYPTPNILYYGYNPILWFVILGLLIRCVQCCRKNW